MKCVECGTEFDDSVKTCPNCGCPVSNDSSTGKVADAPSAEKKSSKVFKINFVALIALVLGIAILFMGFNLKNQSSFKFTFHILANGSLAWKYRLFRHFPFGRYLA